MDRDNPLIRMSGTVIAFILLGFCALVAFLMVMESKLVFYPDSSPPETWNAPPWNLPTSEDVYFNAPDGTRLHGRFVRVDGARATLIWFHGNAGNLGHRIDNIVLLLPLRLNIFIFDYRGYGLSEGAPDEPGVVMDSLAAYDFIVERENLAPDSIVLFGRSLGGATALEVAMQRPAGGIILESAFTSIPAMARISFPFLVPPLTKLVRTRFDNLVKIGKVALPKLILHGTEDSIVPFAQGKELYEAAGHPKRFYAIAGAGHNDTYLSGGTAYYRELDAFICSVVEEPEKTIGEESDMR